MTIKKNNIAYADVKMANLYYEYSEKLNEARRESYYCNLVATEPPITDNVCDEELKDRFMMMKLVDYVNDRYIELKIELGIIPKVENKRTLKCHAKVLCGYLFTKNKFK